MTPKSIINETFSPHLERSSNGLMPELMELANREQRPPNKFEVYQDLKSRFGITDNDWFATISETPFLAFRKQDTTYNLTSRFKPAYLVKLFKRELWKQQLLFRAQAKEMSVEELKLYPTWIALENSLTQRRGKKNDIMRMY